MKVSIAQYDVARGEPPLNLERIRKVAEGAKAAGSDLLCLPEMASTGFDWKKNRELLDGAAKNVDSVAECAVACQLDICGSFLEKTEQGNAANTLYYFDSSGAVVAKYRKIHLFTLFREDRHVEPGETCVVAEAQGIKIGFGVCYDLRFPELFRKNTELGAKLQILPAAFPHPRLEHWQTLVRARAIENQCYFIAANQCGFEGHGDSVGTTQYFGHSTIIDPWGEPVLEAGEEEGLFHAELDLSLVDDTRSKLTALDDRRPEVF